MVRPKSFRRNQQNFSIRKYVLLLPKHSSFMSMLLKYNPFFLATFDFLRIGTPKMETLSTLTTKSFHTCFSYHFQWREPADIHTINIQIVSKNFILLFVAFWIFTYSTKTCPCFCFWKYILFPLFQADQRRAT